MRDVKIELQGEKLLLLGKKALYWQNRNCLVIADAHFGKVAHFRIHGYAISPEAAKSNFEKFTWLLDVHSPEKVIFLGDIFHSSMNREWKGFSNILNERNSEIEYYLVPGNHDILNKKVYESSGITLCEDRHELSPFIFSHIPLNEDESFSGINVSGHLHPGVELRGEARQKSKLPCFYLKANKQLILPAFGEFTGLHILTPGKKDRIFVIARENVVEIPVA